jgi:hypothetical protein
VRFGKDDGLNDMAPWTDDYINILAPLRENMRKQWASFQIDTWFDPLRNLFKDERT